ALEARRVDRRFGLHAWLATTVAIDRSGGTAAWCRRQSRPMDRRNRWRSAFARSHLTGATGDGAGEVVCAALPAQSANHRNARRFLVCIGIDRSDFLV